ncbi:UV-damaged DNA-binding protein rad7 [Rhodotorula kratochvilovae]
MPPRRRNTQDDTPSENQTRVLGPRSALTSFLREQGITGPAARLDYAHRRTGVITQPAATTTAGDDDATQVTLTAAGSTDDDGNNTVTASGSGSVTPASVSTDTNAQAGPSSAAGKKRKGKDAAASKSKKKKPSDTDGDDFNLAGVPHSAPKKGRYENRTPGSIAVCAECGKKFTVSKYTASNPRGGGLLCAPCTSESIEDRAAFPAAVKAKKPVKKKAQRAELETLYTPIPTLQQTCLAVVGQYAADVEALGDIGHKNLDRVAKVLCKNRALTGENLRLFLEVSHRELRLYDCTNVKDHDLASIATFCPHLERLTLNLCGRLDDDVIDAWMKGFNELEHLSLYAPYLVTAPKWVAFLSQCGVSRPEFRTFELRMSSRFDDASLGALVAHSPSLTRLRLAEVGKLSSPSLSALHPLRHLSSLDLSRWGTPQGQVLADADVLALLAEVGAGLSELTLDGNEILTERVLEEGVRRYCGQMRRLSLAGCVEMHTEGVEALFGAVGGGGGGGGAAPGGDAPAGEARAADDTASGAEGDAAPVAVAAAAEDEGGDAPAPASSAAAAAAREPWSSPGLTTFNAHRLGSLSPLAFSALLSHSGRTLRHLNLHSCDELDAALLLSLPALAPNLEVLDLSFVRAVDNFVVQALEDGCAKLRVLFLHGNNRVTAEVPRKAGVQLRGLENALHSEIPPDIPWEL